MSDSKEQIIRVIVEDAQARRKTASRHADEQKLIKSTAAAEQAATDKAEKAYVKSVRTMLSAGKQLETSIKQRAKAEEDAEKRSANAYVDALKKKLAAGKQLETRIWSLADAEMKAGKQQAAAEAKWNKETLASIDKEEKAYVKAKRVEANALATLARQQSSKEKSDRKAIDNEERAYVRAQYKKADALAAIAKEQEASLLGAKGAVVGYFAAFASIGTVVSGVKAMAEYFANIKRDTIDAVKEMLHMRETVMELAAMRDQLGNTTPATVQQLKILSVTGQTQGDLAAMMKSAEGAAQATIGANLTKEAYDEGFLEFAKLQAMEGPGAGQAYGQLFGTIAREAPKGTTGQQLKSRLWREFRVQQPGAFEGLGEYGKQRQDITAFVQNGMLTQEEAAGILSAVSLSDNPAEAATHVRQGMTSLSADVMRARKMKMMEGQEHETSAEYFQKHLMLDPKHTTSMQRLDAVVADLAKGEQDALAKGELWNANDYMMTHGLANEHARKFYMAVASGRKSGQYQAKIVPRMTEQITGDEATAAHNQRIGREPVLRDRLAKASELNAAAIRASSTEGTLLPDQQAAFSQLKEEGKVQGTFEEFAKRRANVLNRISDNLLYNDYDKRFQMRHQMNTMAAAKKAGIDVSGIPLHQYMGDEALAGLTQQVQRAGGNTLAGVEAQSKRAADTMERIEKIITPPVVGPAGAPAAIPMKPAAAGPAARN